MGNDSTEPEMLAKMKAVTVKTQNFLVNINSFLCMRQWGGAAPCMTQIALGEAEAPSSPPPSQSISRFEL